MMLGMERVRKLAIVGGGRAAWAFGNSWLAIGGAITGVLSRPQSQSGIARYLATSRLSSIDELRSAGAVLVAVSDDQLPSVAATVARSLSPDVAFFHPSGSLTSAIFEGTPIRFSLHPLMALPPVGENVSFRDRLLVAEGSDEGISLAREMSAEIGARLAVIEGKAKPAYHAAAVMASNYVAALLRGAAGILARSGVDEVRRSDLLDLARSAAENWASHEGAAAFTGPIARGDAGIVEQHLAALKGMPEREAYRVLGALLADQISAVKDDPRLGEIAKLLKG